MVFDETGSLANVKRHDYLPFGEDLIAGARAPTPGYGAADGVRQKFTGYERDDETGLEFAQARYFASAQGRFTGVDPMTGQTADPQSWNRYTYVGNNPVNGTDPTGMNYFMGGGTVDPGGPTEYRVDGFDMGPEGTASQLDSESMLTPYAQGESQNSGSSVPEQQVDDHAAVADDEHLARIFGDSNAIARGASAASHKSEFMGGGVNHTVHIYGDTSGEGGSALYVPKGFNTVRYEQSVDRYGLEMKNRVVATNSKTGEVLVFVHVAGVSSNKSLQRIWKQNNTNAAGSRQIGFIGGPGGSSNGHYVHSHLTFYRSMQARTTRMSQERQGNYGDFSSYQDMRLLIPRIFPRR
jgi:RHS repeat-associated protein